MTLTLPLLVSADSPLVILGIASYPCVAMVISARHCIPIIFHSLADMLLMSKAFRLAFHLLTDFLFGAIIHFAVLALIFFHIIIPKALMPVYNINSSISRERCLSNRRKSGMLHTSNCTLPITPTGCDIKRGRPHYKIEDMSGGGATNAHKGVATYLYKVYNMCTFPSFSCCHVPVNIISKLCEETCTICEWIKILKGKLSASLRQNNLKDID